MFTSRILCAARSTRGALSRRYATGTTHHVNENNVKGGLKATLHNPRVSEAAKQRAAERLDEFDNGSGAARSSQPIGQREHHASEDTGPSKTRVAAGLKAAIHNPNVSEEAKERAQERLEHMGTSVETTSASRGNGNYPVGSTDETGHETNRVLGGYKATLHNPRTSDEAKQHAREILDADGYQFERPEGVTEDEHQKRVNAGYKAALNNPRVSEGAKQHAREYLEQHGGL